MQLATFKDKRGTTRHAVPQDDDDLANWADQAGYPSIVRARDYVGDTSGLEILNYRQVALFAKSDSSRPLLLRGSILGMRRRIGDLNLAKRLVVRWLRRARPIMTDEEQVPILAAYLEKRFAPVAFGTYWPDYFSVTSEVREYWESFAKHQTWHTHVEIPGTGARWHRVPNEWELLTFFRNRYDATGTRNIMVVRAKTYRHVPPCYEIGALGNKYGYGRVFYHCDPSRWVIMRGSVFGLHRRYCGERVNYDGLLEAMAERWLRLSKPELLSERQFNALVKSMSRAFDRRQAKGWTFHETAKELIKLVVYWYCKENGMLSAIPADILKYRAGIEKPVRESVKVPEFKSRRVDERAILQAVFEMGLIKEGDTL